MKRIFATVLTAAALLAAPALADEMRHEHFAPHNKAMPIEFAILEMQITAPGSDEAFFYEQNPHLRGVELLDEGASYYVVFTNRFQTG